MMHTTKDPAQQRSFSRRQTPGKIRDEHELDQLDNAVAKIEGLADHPHRPAADSPARTPYRPTRDSAELLRLIDKYITRAVKVNSGWVAIGPHGRACCGATLAIAVCRVIAEA